MIDAAIKRVAVDDWWSVLLIAGAVFVFLLGGVTVFLGVKERTITQTVKVEKKWPKPDRVVDGGQVNPQLAGMRCSIYEKRQTIVCEP